MAAAGSAERATGEAAERATGDAANGWGPNGRGRKLQYQLGIWTPRMKNAPVQ